MKTGELKVYAHIWEARPHVSEISGTQLFPREHKYWHWQFSHTLAKGAFGLFRLREDNIVLMTMAEHKFWENFVELSKNTKMYLNHKDKWDALLKKYEDLKT